MDKKKRVTLVVIATIIVGLLVLCGYVGYRFYKHEMSQNEKIQKLSGEIALLKAEEKTVEWNDNSYNYLAIGNSITRHGYVDYWWDDDRGMAASSDNADYVHLVTDHLKSLHDDVEAHSVNFSAWETNYYDRAEFYAIIDPYLCASLNLITIQLGENASNLDTWESDWNALLNYIKEKSPSAEILVVGDFWSNGTRDETKKMAANACDAKYVSLEGIKDNKEYYAGVGTAVEGKSSSDIHIIEHTGVANHPGDKGMAAIADRIIKALK